MNKKSNGEARINLYTLDQRTQEEIEDSVLTLRKDNIVIGVLSINTNHLLFYSTPKLMTDKLFVLTEGNE